MQATVMAVAVGEIYFYVYLSFGDGIQDIFKDTESNLEPVTNYPEVGFF